MKLMLQLCDFLPEFRELVVAWRLDVLLL